MKRRLALFLSLVMLVAMLLPVQAFAAGDDKGLENAIKTAKTKFDIPEDYKFTYSVSTEGKATVWYLSWNAKDGAEGNISVRINSKGTILGYDKYKPYDYPRQRKLPKVSKQEAKAAAESFLKKINPDIFPQFKFQEDEQNQLADYGYNFNLVRIVNGIPFPGNHAYMRVDSDTGEVLGYYMNWSDDIEFPAPEGIISIEQAQKAYKEKMGLRLIYTYRMEDDEKITAYAIYTPKYNSNSYGIDAFTGEKIQIEGGYYGSYYNEGTTMDMKRAAEQAAGGGGGPSLTPEEADAVKEASKLMDVEKAEKIARDTAVLGLSDSFKLSHYNLSRSWPNRDGFNWYLSFNKEADGKGEDYRYVSAAINAKTGEIMNFYANAPYTKDGETAKFDLAASKAEVEKFLKTFKPDKFAETEYDETMENNYLRYMGKESPRQYSFRYERKVSGVPFPANGITVEFDAVQGRVVSFYMDWYNLKFPAVDKVIALDGVYKQLYDKVGVELCYKAKTDEPIPYKTVAESGSETVKAVLLYGLKQGKPYNFDANTGELLGYDGKPYKEVKSVEYTDISGHFAEEKIKILAEYGIALAGTEFKPNESITQKDFFILLSKVLNNYYGPVMASGSGDKDIENMYRILEREGIVKEGEKAPASAVTREDSVKFVIRALKYDKVADIQGIYSISFKDADQIDKNLIGYVAIASGLKIVSGSNGYFNPRKELTRAEAMIIIYNYLQG